LAIIKDSRIESRPATERVPGFLMKCKVHDEEMVPVSWMKRKGIAISTAYMCRSCSREREEGAPIRIIEGPVDHSLDDDDSPYKIAENLGFRPEVP